jgi:hypothetical protein
MSIDLPVGAELAYHGLWTPSLRHQTIFRELKLTGVTDEIVAQVGELRWLRVLYLTGDFADVSALRGLTGLTTLGLDSPRLDALPDSAPAWFPDLELLRLSSSFATGRCLAVVPAGLRLLYLRLPRLRTSFLAALTQIETIVFAGTSLDEPLAQALAGLAPTLTRVEFLGVRVLDPGALAVLDEAGITAGGVS